MRKGLKINFLAILVLMAAMRGFSQVTITGPTCVIPGVVYQYKIQGNWSANSNMQVCLSNGVIADSVGKNNCSPQSGAPLSAVLVIWNQSSSGSIQLKSTLGSTSISVNITSVLSPGYIDTSLSRQAIGTHSIPSLIKCSVATGGSCNPVYNYQWQQSLDMVNWSDIKGATDQNLVFASLIPQSTFFRRKTTETVSGTIAYSNSAMVDVLIILPQSDSSVKAAGSSSTINKEIRILDKRNQECHFDTIFKNEFAYLIEYDWRKEMGINFSEKKLTASKVLYV
jgi:hypothetical protein